MTESWWSQAAVFNQKSAISNHKSRTSLHDGRDCDAHDRECGDEFAADYGDGGQQELFSFFVRLSEDGMAMVEGVEELRQLEDVFGEVGGLGGGDGLVDDVRGMGGG
jgi:hypothetical protein